MHAASGMLISYATAPGSTASDNARGRNGLYTSYLLEALETNPPEDSWLPVDVETLNDARHIGCGAFHCCAVRTSGQAVCWGRGDQQEFGFPLSHLTDLEDETVDFVPFPVAVVGLLDDDWDPHDPED